MKPSRMTKTTAKGTILHWDLDKLDAFEERIITYRLKSKLRVVGDMSLPRAKVKFTYGAGKKERFVVSPVPLFFSKLK
jgi:ribosomal protein S10